MGAAITLAFESDNRIVAAKRSFYRLADPAFRTGNKNQRFPDIHAIFHPRITNTASVPRGLSLHSRENKPAPHFFFLPMNGEQRELVPGSIPSTAQTLRSALNQVDSKSSIGL